MGARGRGPTAMAREGALEHPAVPPDVGEPQKHLPCPRKALDMVQQEPNPDVGDPKTPKAAQNTLEASDVAAETPNPDVLWARNGHRTLLVDSDTDVEEEGPNPGVCPQNLLKIAQNVPETPDMGLATSNPDAPWLQNGCRMLVEESDTDVEEEKADPDVEFPKQPKVTQNIPETPDVAENTPNPDVPGPKMWRGVALVDSDTDVEEDPDMQPQERLKVTQNVPGIPDVEVETPNPAVEAPRMGHWVLLVESDTEEEEEENPDVQSPKWLRMTQNVSKTPDGAVKAPNPDVSGPKLHHQMLMVDDSDTDVENEVNPGVQTQSVPRIPDVEVKTPNPDVEKPKPRHQTLVVDSDTDVEPPKRLKRTQNVSGTPDVQFGTPNPDVSGPKIRSQMLLVDSDTDVEEDPDVEHPKQLRVTQNILETPDVAAETPGPDVSGPKIRCRTFLVDSDTDVEEAEVNPDVEPLRKRKMTPNVPGSPDVGLKTPNPDVGRIKNGCQTLLGDSDTDVEEDETTPDVQPAKRRKVTQNVLESPDVPRQRPYPAVEGPQRGRRALLEDSDTDVEEEMNPDVGSLKRPETATNMPETPDMRLKMPSTDVSDTRVECGTLLVGSKTDVEEDEMSPDVQSTKRMKIIQNVPEPPYVGPRPPNRDVEQLQGTRNSSKIPDVEVEEEGWDPDMATQLFLPSNPDAGEAKVDPDVGSPKLLKTTQKPPKIADVEEETPDPDDDEESGPDVATQLFLPSPGVEGPESSKTPPKDPKLPDVEELPSLDPDVATQLFLPPGPDVEAHPNPDVLGPKQPKIAPNEPRIPDVRVGTPDPDVEEDFDVATQLFLPPNPDVEGESPSDPDVKSLKTPQTPLKCPGVEAETPNPDVERPEALCPNSDVATQMFLSSNPDVEEEGPLDPDLGSPPTPKTPPKLPQIPDAEAETPDLAVEGPGVPCPDPDVATQPLLPLDPDVEHLESPKRALNKSQIPDVEGGPPNPDVGGAPGPAQEDAEAPPTLQVRRSHRLAKSRGGGASAGSTPTQKDHYQEPKPCPSPKPRPQSRREPAGAGLEQATPSTPIKGDGRGSASAPPPQEEEPAADTKRSLRPRTAPGPAQIRVLFTGLVASPALLVALGTLGGTEATSATDCTHLVTDGIRRTLKFLCALGRGVPIVTPQWLLQPQVLVISCPQDHALWAPAVTAGLPLLSAELLLTGVLRQRLDIAQFLLTPLNPPDPPLKTPNPPPKPQNPTQKPQSSTQKTQNPPKKKPDPARKPPNPPRKSQNPTPNPPNTAQNHQPPPQKNPSPAQNTPASPHTPPPSPPRTRSGWRHPQNPPQNPSNSGNPPKSPNPHQKTPKRPRGHSEGPDPNFGVSDPPQEPPRTRSRWRPPQNPPLDPPNSGMPQKTPKRPQKTPNPPPKKPNLPRNAPKQPRDPPGGLNPNFGVPSPLPDAPPEPPRTRSGRRPPQNSGMAPKTPNLPTKAPKGPQNAPNSTQNRPRGLPEDPHPKFGVSEPPPSLPRTRSRRGPPRDPPKSQ
ncbi:mediator of DNA damage checkpoint protein 1 isoform X2 [Prinia subflava]|uniref:mediator of DNA damage checkpoint protein 1 isoform X2 n=1 Tax=Prinia subflava TaxID=208062 RepID=UPI002FE2CB01